MYAQLAKVRHMEPDAGRRIYTEPNLPTINHTKPLLATAAGRLGRAVTDR